MALSTLAFCDNSNSGVPSPSFVAFFVAPGLAPHPLNGATDWSSWFLPVLIGLYVRLTFHVL
jgi:hypothetical protein